MLKKKITTTLSPFLVIVPNLFAFTLLLYIGFFLIENLFHGFVSNNFDLNIFLVPIVFFGILSPFAPAKIHEEKKVERNDFILAAGISFLALLMFLYKTWGMGVQGILVSFASAFFIAFVSLIMIFMPEKEEETDETNIAATKILSRSFFSTFYFRAGMVAMIVLVATGAILFISRSGKQPDTGKEIVVNSVPSEEKDVFTEVSTPFPDELKKTPIIILRGGVLNASASAVATTLNKKNFVIQRITDADNKNYKNAVIKFLPDQVEIAEYLAYVLKDTYSVIERAPLPPGDKAIILILGKSQ